MSRTLFAKLVLILAVAAVLSTPLNGWSAERRPIASGPRASFVARTLANPLSSLWVYLSRLMTKEGCGIDPSGRCIPTPPPSTPTTDNGCGIDPHGCAVTSIFPKPAAQQSGCGIDPSGGCTATK